MVCKQKANDSADFVTTAEMWKPGACPWHPEKVKTRIATPVIPRRVALVLVPLLLLALLVLTAAWLGFVSPAQAQTSPPDYQLVAFSGPAGACAYYFGLDKVDTETGCQVEVRGCREVGGIVSDETCTGLSGYPVERGWLESLEEGCAYRYPSGIGRPGTYGVQAYCWYPPAEGAHSWRNDRTRISADTCTALYESVSLFTSTGCWYDPAAYAAIVVRREAERRCAAAHGRWNGAGCELPPGGNDTSPGENTPTATLGSPLPRPLSSATVSRRWRMTVPLTCRATRCRGAVSIWLFSSAKTLKTRTRNPGVRAGSASIAVDAGRAARVVTLAVRYRKRVCRSKNRHAWVLFHDAQGAVVSVVRVKLKPAGCR